MDEIEQKAYDAWKNAPVESLEYAKQNLLVGHEYLKEKEERYRKEIFAISAILAQRK